MKTSNHRGSGVNHRYSTDVNLYRWLLTRAREVPIPSREVWEKNGVNYDTNGNKRNARTWLKINMVLARSGNRDWYVGCWDPNPAEEQITHWVPMSTMPPLAEYKRLRAL